MKRFLGLSLCALILAGCQTTGQHTAPVCSGKNKRPMNVYPSVIPNPAIPAIPAAVTPAQTPVVGRTLGEQPDSQGQEAQAQAKLESNVHTSCE